MVQFINALVAAAVASSVIAPVLATPIAIAELNTFEARTRPTIPGKKPPRNTLPVKTKRPTGVGYDYNRKPLTHRELDEMLEVEAREFYDEYTLEARTRPTIPGKKPPRNTLPVRTKRPTGVGYDYNRKPLTQRELDEMLDTEARGFDDEFDELD